MLFAKQEFSDALQVLRDATTSEERAVGDNFLWEENVGDARRDDFESQSMSPDLRQAAETYFRTSIEGSRRGHVPSTFKPDLNELALLPETLDPNQKIIRLERIDELISREPTLDYNRLVTAYNERDPEVLTHFARLFATFPGERPAFVAFKAEVEADLTEGNWLERLVYRMGLYHNFPLADSDSYAFALMEYTAAEVFRQAAADLKRPFAVATVLECRNNPAFFPVPKGSENGFTVDLSPDAARPMVREVLHIRLDYRKEHVVGFGRLDGPKSTPELDHARQHHAQRVRETSGRDDFARPDMSDAGS